VLKLLVVVLDTSMAAPELHHTRWYLSTLLSDMCRRSFSDMCRRSSISKYKMSVQGSGIPISCMPNRTAGHVLGSADRFSSSKDIVNCAENPQVFCKLYSTILAMFFDLEGPSWSALTIGVSSRSTQSQSDFRASLASLGIDFERFINSSVLLCNGHRIGKESKSLPLMFCMFAVLAWSSCDA
jgi:hypothetical protein